MKNFGRPGQFLKVWKKIRNVREGISEKMYGKKSRGSKVLATWGRGDFVKFYLAPLKMRVAPQMPPQIPRPGAATADVKQECPLSFRHFSTIFATDSGY